MNALIAARMKIAIIAAIGAAMETATVDVICWESPVGVGSNGRDEDEGKSRTDKGGRKSLVGSGDSWVGEGSTCMVGRRSLWGGGCWV